MIERENGKHEQLSFVAGFFTRWFNLNLNLNLNFNRDRKRIMNTERSCVEEY